MSKIEFTVLGNAGPYPNNAGLCSGYLVKAGGKNILLDCGCGIYAKLIKRMPLEKIDAIVLTHLHSDHMADMLVIRYAIEVNELPKIKVFMPETPEAEAYILKNSSAFDIEIIEDNVVYNIGDVKLTFASMKHSVECHAVKVTLGKVEIVYTGDTMMNDVLPEFAHWCDMLICDAAFSDDTHTHNAPHASAKQAAIMAKKANVAKLLLTHFKPGISTESHLAEAKSEFRYTAVAVPNLTINI